MGFLNLEDIRKQSDDARRSWVKKLYDRDCNKPADENDLSLAGRLAWDAAVEWVLNTIRNEGNK